MVGNWKKQTALAVVMAGVLSGATSAYADAETVFDHHLKAFIERNMEANLADYTDNSVVIIPGKTFRGLAEIEGFFGAIFDEFAQEGTSFELTEKRVEGDIVYISWTADTPDNVYRYATDTFLIQDDKIMTQTIGLVVEPK